MNKGMLLDGQDNSRFNKLIFIVVELLGSFLCHDESEKRKETWAPVRWSDRFEDCSIRSNRDFMK